MSNPLLTTKLHIPKIRTTRVLRPHLLFRLQEGLAQKLILISAPAGYGKTTLLCEWLAVCGLPTAWISLDKGDNDPVRFWAYGIASLQNVFSSVGKTLPDILTSSNQAPSETFLIGLINELAKLQQPLILVLDDYFVIETQAIHDGLLFLLEHAPPHLHICISTRADPPLPLARLRAHSQIMELRLADLRFSTQEISEFLCKGMGLNLSEADLNLLEISTEGWIAGLQMAGLSLQGRADASSFIKSFSGENRYILDFLFDEVFERQPEDIQNFLLQTSILERLCGPLCDQVTLRKDSQAILETLERNNLFILALDEQRKWYRYHHLFGDLLKSRLKPAALPDSSAILHRRASIWFAEEHDPENAIAHALAAKDFERAAGLIEQVVHYLDMQNQQAILASWMDSLPREILETRPWLCVYLAWGYYWTGRREMEEQWLQAAEKSIERAFDIGSAERQHIQGHIAAVRAHTALVAENIPRALEMGQKAFNLLPDGDEMCCETAIALGGVYWALGDVIQSEQAFGMARTAAMKVGYTSMEAASTCYMGIQQVKQGRLQDAIATFREGLRMATLPDNRETPMAGFPNVRLGDVWRERNELGRASEYLFRGMEQSVHLNQPDLLTDAYVCLGRYQVAVGDLEKAQETLRKADLVAQQSKVDPWVLCGLDDCHLRTWLADGNLEAANLWAQNSGLSLDGSLSYQHDLHHQNLARVFVAQGILTGSKSSQDKASSLLARLRIATEKAGWVHEGIKILVLQAVNYQTHGTSEAALQSLAQAVCLAEPGGYVRVFLDEGELARELLTSLASFLENGQQLALGQKGLSFQKEQLALIKEYVSKLLLAFDVHANRVKQKYAVPTSEGQNRNNQSEQPTQGKWIVEPLTTREMEVLRLLAQGCSDKKISESLVIARETVHKHLKNIYEKLDVHSRTEAIARARKAGLL